jgi:hypothetical protein
MSTYIDDGVMSWISLRTHRSGPLARETGLSHGVPFEIGLWHGNLCQFVLPLALETYAFESQVRPRVLLQTFGHESDGSRFSRNVEEQGVVSFDDQFPGRAGGHSRKLAFYRLNPINLKAIDKLSDLMVQMQRKERQAPWSSLSCAVSWLQSSPSCYRLPRLSVGPQSNLLDFFPSRHPMRLPEPPRRCRWS